MASEKCHCGFAIGIIAIILGIVTGITGESGFGLVQILAIIVGVLLLLCNAKASKFCKCKK